jgi:hypothetical protein
MDVIWGHHCPVYYPFNISVVKSIEGVRSKLKKVLAEDDFTKMMWKNIFEHAHRILKSGGKVILPNYFTDSSVTLNSLPLIRIITHILNMELYPQYLYTVNIVHSFSKDHKEYMKNLFILEKDELKENTLSSYWFLVLEKV